MTRLLSPRQRAELARASDPGQGRRYRADGSRTTCRTCPAHVGPGRPGRQCAVCRGPSPVEAIVKECLS